VGKSELNEKNKHTIDTQEIDVHMKTLKNTNENENLYEIFKKKEYNFVNKIHLIEDSDHLKEAIKKIDALNAIIEATLKQSIPSKEFIKINNDPPNKKIIPQNNFFFYKIKAKKKPKKICLYLLNLKVMIYVTPF